MPMPLWWGEINKRLFNPRALKNGKWDVITHRGRSSGKVYRTPLDATEVDGTFIFIVVYGSQADWVQNILAGGSASLETGGEVIELVEPRLLSGEMARPLLDGMVTLPPAFLNVNEYLQMDIASRRSATSSEPVQSEL
jgi:deazaflavin-dependent oxidoreductase (nitroreductase family)